MENTNLKVKEISVADLLNHPDQAYNPQIWKERVNRYSTFPKIQFYIAPKDGKVYSYNRFFASYIADGIYFFNRFDPFMSCISNAGFCKVHIDGEGNVMKSLFIFGYKEIYAANTPKNREIFRSNLTPLNIMVSTLF